jgi:hypothetical protein
MSGPTTLHTDVLVVAVRQNEVGFVHDQDAQ